jgi:hypothetical protein
VNTFERLDSNKLNKAVRRVRNRWRIRVALRGVGIALIAGFLALLALSWGLDTMRYRPWALFAFSAATYAGLLGLILRFIVLPLSTRVSDDRVALYIGEQAPGLRAELISAVEMADFENDVDPTTTSPEFAREVVQSAVYHLHEIDYGRRVERGNLQRFSTLLASAIAFVMLMGILSPAFLRTGAPLLFMPWARSAFANPYAIEVLPGDVQIARGADQTVTAKLVGFDSDRIEIALRSAGGDWERWPMTNDEGSDEYFFMVFDVGSDTEYFVESAGVRSNMYDIEVVDLPYVDTMLHEYRFPAYSGLETMTVEEGGDIAVLLGTEVWVRITPTVQVPAGRLMISWIDPGSDEEPVAVDLAVAADGVLTGAFEVTGAGSYRVELEGFRGAMAAASPDYFIDALKDQPPRVAFETPGRDTTVSPLDEAYVEVIAEDDFGITGVELIYSVNGGEEVSVPLFRPNPGDPLINDVTADHTFYLEEEVEQLEPGDFISYYARAYDHQDGGVAQDTTTDIYFMEVRALDRIFRQSQEGGGGGGGGGGQGQEDTAFARRQRQIVSATFRLIRDRSRIEDTQYESDLGTLAVNQSRLREQVELVLGRTSQRGAAMPGSDFAKMAEYLRNAISEMAPAEEELGRMDAEAALPPEQRALQHLQRAEALMRDVQVSFQQGGGGGGGGQQQDSVNEDLADLLALEMEKLRNQYEQVQRGEQQQADQEVDEALQRLEELARRQQQENERQRRLAGLPQNQQGGGGGGNQRQLADDAEELARQLQRLARENQEPRMEELSRSLQEAADSMRRAAAANDDRALAEGLSALNNLQRTRDDLQGERSRRLQRDLEDVQNRVDKLQEDQEKIADDVKQIGADAARGGDLQRRMEQMERLLEFKDELAAEIADLEDQVETMARDSRREEREAARKLQETSNWMRDSKLADKVRYSKGVAQQRLGPYAEQFEAQITNDLDRLGDMIDEAQELVDGPQENELDSSLDDTRDLIRGLESLAERYDQGAERQQQGQQGEQGEGQQGEQGEGQQGQQGEGQQGQQGQGQQGQGQQGQQGQGQQGQQGQGQQGQQGGSRNQGGRLGGRRAGGDNFGGGGNWDGAWDGDWSEQQRQYAAEYGRRVEEAEDLRNRLAEEGQQVTDLDAILDAMREWQFDGTPRGIDELRDDVIEGLKLYEYALRRLAEADGGSRPALTDSDEVPEGYRKLVEEYFRALGRAQGGSGGRQR